MDTINRTLDETTKKGYLCDINLERLKRAEELAAKYNTTVPMIAMRYMFSTEMNVYSVVSSTKPENIRMNVEAAGNRLSDVDVRFLHTV